MRRSEACGRGWRGACRWGLALLLATAGAFSAEAQGWKSPPQRAPEAPTAADRERAREAIRPGGVYSNLGLLDLLTRQAATELADSLRLPEGEPVTLMATSWHEANWYVGQFLGEVLAARGHRVQLGDWGAASTGAPSAGSPTPPAPSRAQVPGAPRDAGGVAGGEDGEDAVEGDLLDPTEADTTGAYADSVAAATADPLWGTPTPVEVEDEGGAVPLPPPLPVRPAGGAAVPGAPGRGGAERRPGPGSLPAGTVVDLRILEFGIGYPDAGRRLLFGPLRFTRVGGVSVQASWLEGPEGRFRRLANAERHRVDRLSGSQRALVEGASYPFAPPLLQAPSLGRYIEPVVVTAIIGSLVYLFYTNQN